MDREKGDDNRVSDNHDKTPAAACKAVQFFDDHEPSSRYERDVFLWTSVDGVRRLTFANYMALIQEPHDARYRLARLSVSELGDGDPLVAADADFIQTSTSRDPTGDKAYMAFRSVWRAATGETMPI